MPHPATGLIDPQEEFERWRQARGDTTTTFRDWLNSRGQPNIVATEGGGTLPVTPGTSLVDDAGGADDTLSIEDQFAELRRLFADIFGERREDPEKERKERLLRRNRLGVRGSILTSGRGLLSEPSLRRPTLLGG